MKYPHSGTPVNPVNLVLGVYGGSGRGVSEKAVPVIDVAAPARKSQPSTQPPDLVQPSAPAPDKPRKQTFMENADTWRELDRAYQAHHFKCPICKAAGLGYGLRCGAGAALWTAYSDAN